jgi:hypothetical protein
MLHVTNIITFENVWVFSYFFRCVINLDSGPCVSPLLKNEILLLKLNGKCVLNVSTKITMQKINDTRIFVNEV